MFTTRIEKFADGCWQTCSVSTTAVPGDPCRDHEADLAPGVYEKLEDSWFGDEFVDGGECVVDGVEYRLTVE